MDNLTWQSEGELLADHGGIDFAGECGWLLADYMVIVSLDSNGLISTNILEPAKGDKLETLPLAVMEAHIAELREIKETSARLRRTTRALKDWLKEKALAQTIWTGKEWRQIFAANPILGNLSTRLVWSAERPEYAQQLLTYPQRRIVDDGLLVHDWLDLERSGLLIADEATLRLALLGQDITTSQEEWCQYFVDRKLTQPYNQLFKDQAQPDSQTGIIKTILTALLPSRGIYDVEIELGEFDDLVISQRGQKRHFKGHSPQNGTSSPEVARKEAGLATFEPEISSPSHFPATFPGYLPYEDMLPEISTRVQQILVELKN